MKDFKCVLSRVVFYTSSPSGVNSIYCDYHILIPLSLDLFSALSFAEFAAEDQFRKEHPNVEISDVSVTFRKSFQTAEDPSVLP